ncbi:MAG: type II toxin-antitoxin system VapC family toxin [Rhizobiaceae bacterium]|nr:type II toxin-antitoxin system VapC family toxin [Rhizobiaceae bacterium]
MMFLLDTNVISELRVLGRAAALVVSWSAAQDRRTFFLSAATVMELQYGALLLSRRDPRQGEPMMRWVNERVLPDFADRVLPMTSDIAMICAGLHVPNRRGERDAWIAATAIVHDLTVVTRNVRDFEGTGARLLNPWQPQP